MQLEVKPFEPEDLSRVEGREMKFTEADRPVADFYYEKSFFTKKDGTLGRSAFTAFEQDRAVGCAGVIFLPENKGEVWMHLSQEMGRKPLWLTKTALTLLIGVMKESDLELVECFIPFTKPVNRNWIKRIGFEEGPAVEVRGEPCIQYAMKGWN
jgi:hypothetical protein